jgi:signal transduction histidine kinase
MSEPQAAALPAEEVRARLRERQLLLMLEIDRRILDRTHTLAETLHHIVTETRHILNAQHVDILFEYPDGLRNEISSDPAEIGLFIPIEKSISGLVLSRREPVLVNDLQGDPQLSERYYPRMQTDQTGQTDIAPALNVLVGELTLEGQPIGVINVETTGTRFDESHLDFVKAVARQVSVALVHAALFDEDIFRIATDRLLMEASTGDTDRVLREVLEQIVSTLNSLAFVKPDAADILFEDPQDDQRLVVAHSTNNADIGVRVEIGSSICGEAFRTRQTVVAQRASDRPDYRPVVPGMRCEMAIPIIFGGSNRFPIGVLNLECRRENAFSNVGRALAERFTRRMVNAIAMTKIRADIDVEMQDQLMVLAADQVLNAVHRINNHVGSVRALARDLIEDLRSVSPPAADDLAHRLQMIEQDAGRALEIPNELRRRIGTPQVSVDVNAQVEAGLRVVRIPKTIHLATDLAPSLPTIPCTALDLVIENLLLNAVKAMHDRPGTLTVTTRLDERLPREPFIEITVADTGAGMTSEERARLFEPRQAVQRGSGLGFGMMWVRSWIRRAQGLIEVDSEPDVGTTVRIRFQLRPPAGEQVTEGGEPS